MNKALFTSNSNEWETPQYIFDYYNKIYNFTFDACASHDNYKIDNYYTEDEAQCLDWEKDSVVWLNPPYSNLKYWIEYAYNQIKYIKSANTVVMLIPARTDTIAWHKYVSKGDVTFLKGRLKFSNSKNSAPFPSAIVVFSRHILLNTKGSAQYLDIKKGD